ncbi:coiled-coil domain-containing protein 81 isoform X5 [Pongo abelii]|uniref:coiled-coil domain-containing protein 81 isoform X5 n=1 Tax=Pongo abelii TaxID=9601 RepID=UPI003006350E
MVLLSSTMPLLIFCQLDMFISDRSLYYLGECIRICETAVNPAQGDIPIVPLNFVMVSLEGPFNRDVVEGCVKETLLFLSRSISMKQNVEFTFKGIGVLMIRDSKVKMRFYKDFLCTMDGSGALAKALANRPGTVDSVLSSREALRKWPSSVLAFPRIELKEMENKLPMETLVEECGENREKCKLKDQSDKEEGTRDISSPKRLRDRQALFPAKVTNVSLLEKFERSESGGKIMTPESLSSPSCLKHDSEMKPQTSPACQDHNKAGQMKSLATREQNQKNAAYNLGVAEAIRSHKNEKPEFYKSFLFDKRPLSPELNALKQEEYSRSLLKQMDNRQENKIKQRQYRELMDRLEQVQLTEELAAQRAKFLKDKMEETQCYKRALDAQIKNKPSRLPAFEPDSSEPIFGKNEGELMVEKQKREQNYMKHQLEAAANHKRKAILHQLVDQRRDLQMLQRTQREHLADRTAELERVNRVNQCLQEDWERSAVMKKQRDLEDKAFERASDKLFLLDQCEKYRRCKQCQRRTSNVGESNLWPLNKFLPGSRLLV